MLENISYTLTGNCEFIPLLLLCLASAAGIFLLFRYCPALFRSSGNGLKPAEKRNIALVTLLYAVVSFYKAGAAVFPRTVWQPSASPQDVIFELTGDTAFSGIYVVCAEGDNNAVEYDYQCGFHHMHVYGSQDLEHWEEIAELDGGMIFQYTILSGEWDYRYVKLHSDNTLDTVSEFALRNMSYDGFVPLQVCNDAYAASVYPASLLVDEQEKLVLYPTYEHAGYFDEVYHPRNAWEIAAGQRMYGTVHPLLGTNIMAFFIRFFGLSPFVWRFPGLIAGILMIPLLYMILKEMHFPDHMCLAGIVLLASDFMHLTTSRIGTLEPFSILTIMWMYLYMIRYYHTSFYTTPLRKQLVLLLQCGMMMGISIAVKWTACYSAVGLAVLLFTNLIRRFLEYLQAGKNLQTSGTDETSMHIRRTFIPCFLKTTACCFVFFIFIPAVIYWLSYLPDHVWRDGWSIANVWQQNVNMYNYHINLNATHPFQSMWYEWVLDLRPVWYHISTDISGYKHSIACFSNPIVTWAGLPAILYAMYRACRHKDHSAWIITVGYLTAMVPWISLVQRCVFSYHFYPSSIFTVMAVVYMMNDLAVSFPSIKKYIPLIPAAAVILFVLFLPVTAGFGTSLNFIHALEWFESWYFG